MSGYNGRRAPNFSQYLNDLNTVPSPYDQTLQQDQGLFDVDAELALFTNAEFFDFDSRGDMSSHVPVSLGEDLAQSEPTSSQDVKYLDMLNDFNLPNYQYYTTAMGPSQAPAYSAPPQQPPSHTNAASGSPPQPVASQPTPQETQPRPQHTTTTPTTVGTKRKQDASTLDEAARLAQEEDKRRRNTAASARFRIKKKEREKNLERTVKDVTAKNAALEARVSQLELENRWLKNLITEKNGSMLSDGDISGMFTKFRDSKEGQAATQQQQVKTETDETESRAS
ncbi:hypothetical protein D8B26_003593 [Coccidioides posadasii str. Silveira]|uniref:Positive sulfur transcription regulator METR n=1 Tax=Coccidioides posadasii RMSCC 3488 TaxID=454284 RepID=A0A0J6INL8_COCPO|nr:positive sulfur transcription regulator METR [Coccidioides posadasii RMSCC 3488]QVM08922.1 hypothetical protein D8B26_003593 [Coccidioides posadasii str. Silveira]